MPTLTSNLQPRECDMYRNPTILSRLIRNRHFASAVRRLDEHRAEASVWICTKRRSETVLRQLPLHMACAQLRVEDENWIQLVGKLVLVFPEATSLPDGQGRLALAQVLTHEKVLPTIVVALTVPDPDILYRTDDYYQATPIEVYQQHHTTPDPQILALLRKPQSFWETAQHEVRLRLQHRNMPTANGDDDDMVLSTSVLDAIPDETETLVTTPSMLLPPTPDPPEATNEPTTWEQLEHRALHCEQQLAEALEQVYRLEHETQRLKAENERLTELQHEWSSSHFGARLLTLHRQKLEWQAQAANLQALLDKHGLCDASVPGQVQVPPALADLQRENAQLREQVDLLTAQNIDCRDRLQFLEDMLDRASSIAKSESSHSSGTPDHHIYPTHIPDLPEPHVSGFWSTTSTIPTVASLLPDEFAVRRSPICRTDEAEPRVSQKTAPSSIPKPPLQRQWKVRPSPCQKQPTTPPPLPNLSDSSMDLSALLRDTGRWYHLDSWTVGSNTLQLLPKLSTVADNDDSLSLLLEEAARLYGKPTTVV